MLALYQWSIGIRTDEAKYLLDIPYPHPPLARYLLSLFSSPLWMEFFFRLFFATLIVQAVWFFLDKKRTAMNLLIAAAWLLSGSVILQAGSIMMAPLTAFSAVVFLWLLRRLSFTEWQLMLVALFWLASLFIAYQAALLLPLVLVIFWRSRLPLWKQCLYVGGPVAMLILYTLTNPLALASMLNVAGKDASITFFVKIFFFLQLFFLSGSGVVATLGIIGLAYAKKWTELCAFGLIAVYVFFSFQEYYGILFVPFFIIGMKEFLPLLTPIVRWGLFETLLILIQFLPFAPLSNTARDTLAFQNLAPHKDILVVGSFGHEWQYYSDAVILRYSETFKNRYDAIVCLDTCSQELLRGRR